MCSELQMTTDVYAATPTPSLILGPHTLASLYCCNYCLKHTIFVQELQSSESELRTRLTPDRAEPQAIVLNGPQPQAPGGCVYYVFYSHLKNHKYKYSHTLQ